MNLKSQLIFLWYEIVVTIGFTLGGNIFPQVAKNAFLLNA
jgi:hypothetical protein